MTQEIQTIPPPVAPNITKYIADDRSSLTKLSMKELKELGDVFYASGAFDVKSAAAAMVKIIAGAELGFSPMVAMTGIHFFQGKVEFSSTLKASLIKESGKYDYKVIAHTNERCEIAFFEKSGDTWVQLGVPVVYTMADATAAGLLSKDTWKKYPADLLFATCIRQGFRRYCAEILHGIGADEDTPAAEAVDLSDAETQHAIENRSGWLRETILKAGRLICTEPQLTNLQASLETANLPELEERLISATAKLHTVVIAKIGEKLQNEEAANAFCKAHLPLNGDSDVDTLCKALETLETVAAGEVVSTPTESTQEAPAINAEPVHSTPEPTKPVDPEPTAIEAVEEPPRASGNTTPLAPPAEPAVMDSATEDLRVSCQERLSQVPSGLFKDMIAGLPPVGSMSKTELETLDGRLKKVETGF